MNMYKDHKRVKDGMNIGRGLSKISGSGQGALATFLAIAGMVAFVIICKKFGIM